MVNVLVSLQVQDYAKWRPVFDEYNALRKTNGCQSGSLYRPPNNSNQVVILFGWNTLDNARRFFDLPEVREGMQRAGVQERPDIVFLDRQEKLAL
ncbi:MAG: antibiotic biosynthesis monooxygenase [Chloroflexota bacterium]